MKRLARRGWIPLALLAVATSGFAEQVVWTDTFSGPNHFITRVLNVAADGSGNIYAVGSSEDVLPGQSSSGAFVRKDDAAGHDLWTDQFGAVYAKDVAVDAAGSAYVIGYTKIPLPGATPVGETNAFVRKYNANGSVAWTKELGFLKYNAGQAIAVDAAGNSFVVGQTYGDYPSPITYDTQQSFLGKLDPAGNVLWLKRIPMAGGDSLADVAVDRSGNAFVVGSTNGILPLISSDHYDGLVAKYSPSGSRLWRRHYGTIRDEWANSVATGPDGSAYVAGIGPFTPIPAVGTNYYGSLRRYAPDGSLKWSRGFGFQGNTNNVFDVAASASSVTVLAVTVDDPNARGLFPTYRPAISLYQFAPSGKPTARGFFDNFPKDVVADGVTFGPSGSLIVGGYSETGIGDVHELGDGFVTKLLLAPSCTGTANPTGNEDGVISRPVHTQVEPLAVPFGSTVHGLNCTVVVPHGL